jgi:hypothetical protein
MASNRRRFAIWVGALGALLCVGALVAAPTASAEHLVINHGGTGAVAAGVTCTPQGEDLQCDDVVIQYGRFPTTRDGRNGPEAPALIYEHFKATVHPDGTADEVVAETGMTTDVTGGYDKARLRFASVEGATLDLYDITEAGLVPNGRTVELGPFTWTAASPIHVYGNDGPFGFGLPRFFRERCVTAIENAHERFTAARVSGTINGLPFDELYGPSYLPWPGIGPPDALGAIHDNRFTVVIQSHGPECEPV